MRALNCYWLALKGQPWMLAGAIGAAVWLLASVLAGWLY